MEDSLPPQSEQQKQQSVFFTTLAFFTLSGATSLMYEVIWTRLLVFVFGCASFATATVLCVFMGGLALGALFISQFLREDRIKSPLMVYAILEGIIGVYAMVAPSLFSATIPVYKILWQHFHISIIQLSLLRFGIASCILLIPTACMGATLPLLCTLFAGDSEKVGRNTGALYSANTAGAIAGATAAGFVLMPTFGISATTNLAAAGNLVLCVIAAIYAKQCIPQTVGPLRKIASVPGPPTPSQPSVEPDVDLQILHPSLQVEQTMNSEPTNSQMVRSNSSETNDERNAKLSEPNIARMSIAFAMSGAVAMICEVCWTRALLMVIGSSTYAFTLMLVSFLLGLFIGSAIMARCVDKFKEPLLLFCVLQLFGGMSILAAVLLFTFAPYLNIVINAHFLGNADAALCIRFLIAAAVLLPSAIIFGATFPVAVKALNTDARTVGTQVAKLYSANTAGAIFGSFFAGFVLLPGAGAERTLVLAALTSWGIAASLVATNRSYKMTIRLGTLALWSLVFTCAIRLPEVWDPILLAANQQIRRFETADSGSLSFQQWRDKVYDTYPELLFARHGLSETVSVLKRRTNLGNEAVDLFTNGQCEATYCDAVGDSDICNEVLITGFPLLMRPQAKHAAVIGWGSGICVATAALFTPKVEAIELEAAVIEASEYFSQMNHEVQHNPGVTIEVNDGRNFLQCSNEKFDFIASEVSHPARAGVCNLFTKDYFEICKNRLEPGGIFSTWQQIYDSSPHEYLRMCSTATAVFKYVFPMIASDGDTVLIASDEQPSIDYAGTTALLKQPQFAAQFGATGISTTDDVLARIVTCPSALRAQAANVPPNTDDKNAFEYIIGKTYESKRYFEEGERFIDTIAREPWEIVHWGPMPAADKAAAMKRVARICLKLNAPNRALQWAQQANKLQSSLEATELIAKCRESLRRIPH